jgi:TolB-like protein/DNA-binding winged helix-turn-helix (wHTH) protein/tetratricopeptide (TPR) repeat protein
MSQMSQSRETFRFGDFALDVSAYELRHQGHPVRLERRPMDLLVLLVERCGQLVTRNEIIDQLWGKDVFVDVDTGINTIIWKVRAALRDSKDEPVFVETVAGRGYRFIAPVEVVPAAGAPAVPSSTPVAVNRRGHVGLIAALVAVALVAAAFVMRSWFTESQSSGRITVAVLPFENVGGGPEREYLADGLAEETTSSLGQIDPDHLGVVGRTSIIAYKRMGKPVAEMLRELRVDYVVEGAVRTDGDRLRLTSKLLRATDQAQVWTTSYDRELSNTVGLQRELSTAIAEQVRLQLVPDRVGQLSRRQTQSPDAFDAYLRGRYFQNRRNRESTLRAVRYYEHAIALDPNYALAWSGLALTHAASVINSDARPHDVAPLARDAASNAVRANSMLTEAQFAAGYVSWLLDWEWESAEIALRRAVEIDPSNAMALRTLGHVLSQMGRHREAEDAMRRMRTLDSFSAMNHALSSQVAFQARDNAAAIKHARQAILIDSTLWIGHMQLAQAYGQTGETDLALEALADAARFSGGENSKTLSLRGYVLATTSRTGEAREALRTLEGMSRERYLPPYAIALVYAGLGEREAVFEWLEKAFAARDVHLIFLPVDPKWDPFRSDQRFEALVARCGFAPRASNKS